MQELVIVFHCVGPPRDPRLTGEALREIIPVKRVALMQRCTRRGCLLRRSIRSFKHGRRRFSISIRRPNVFFFYGENKNNLTLASEHNDWLKFSEGNLL